MRPLVLPHGVLSGIGRRVSSLFFGAQTTEVQELRRAVVIDNEGMETMVLVLTSSNLQRWRIADQVTEEVTPSFSPTVNLMLPAALFFLNIH